MEDQVSAELFSGANQERYRRHRVQWKRDVQAVPTVEHDALMVLASMPEKIHAQQARMDRPGIFSKMWTFITGVPPAKDRRKKALRDHRRKLARANADAFRLVLEQQRAGAETLRATNRHLEAFHGKISRVIETHERQTQEQVALLALLNEQVRHHRGQISTILDQLERIECRQQFVLWNQRVELGPSAFRVQSQLTASWLYVDAIALHCPELTDVDRDLLKERVRRLNDNRSQFDIEELSSKACADLTPIQKEALGLQRERMGGRIQQTLTDAIVAPVLGLALDSSCPALMDVDEFVERLLEERQQMLDAERAQAAPKEPAASPQDSPPEIATQSPSPPSTATAGASSRVIGGTYWCEVAGQTLQVRLPSGSATDDLDVACGSMCAKVAVLQAQRSSQSYLARARLVGTHPLAQLFGIRGAQKHFVLQVRVRTSGPSSLEVTAGLTTRAFPLRTFA